MPRRTWLAEIKRLDPTRDYKRIVYIDTCYEFPYDTTRSLEFALFRTFAVPSISRLLDETGEFAHHTQKRRDDTDLILSEILEHGYESERGRDALRLMNRQHGQYEISNEDYLYVLSTFVMEPIRWMERYSWRAMVEEERIAAFYYWRELARHMNIKDLPATYEELERYNVEYERAQFRFAESNRRVGTSTRNLFISWFLPKPLWPLGAPVMHAMMDDALLDAFHFPRPPRLLRALVRRGLRLRGHVVALLPERKKPVLRTRVKFRAYPQGYLFKHLGPAHFHETARQEEDVAS